METPNCCGLHVFPHLWESQCSWWQGQGHGSMVIGRVEKGQCGERELNSVCYKKSLNTTHASHGQPLIHMLVKALKYQTWVKLPWNGSGAVLFSQPVDEHTWKCLRVSKDKASVYWRGVCSFESILASLRMCLLVCLWQSTGGEWGLLVSFRKVLEAQYSLSWCINRY